MGRACKVVEMSTGKRGKKEKLNRKRQQEELKTDRALLEAGPPDWLDETASTEFRRVVDEAAKLPLYDNLDFSTLAIYAAAYSQYIEAVKHLRYEGYTIINKGGFETMSPWVNVADKAAGQIFKASTKLGLAVTDRLKLIVPTKEEAAANKFVKYLPSGAGA